MKYDEILLKFEELTQRTTYRTAIARLIAVKKAMLT